MTLLNRRILMTFLIILVTTFSFVEAVNARTTSNLSNYITVAVNDNDDDGILDDDDPDDDNDGVLDTVDYYPNDSQKFHNEGTSNVLITVDSAVTEPLAVSEMGKATTFKVRLALAPTASVVLPLNPTTNLASVNVSELVFTPENWNQDQSITMTGLNDSLERGNRTFSLSFKPLISTDSSFNGNQVLPIELVNHSLIITTSISQTFATGDEISLLINTESNEDSDITFTMPNPKQGMLLHPRTHKIHWTPVWKQAGIYQLKVVCENANGGHHEKYISLTITEGAADPTNDVVFVVPGASDAADRGTATDPLGSLKYATENIAVAGDTIYIRGGIYTDLQKLFDNATEADQATLANPITVKPYGNEKVIFKYEGYLALKIEASHVIIDGIEIDGMAVNDHVDIIERCWWKNAEPVGASKCIQATSGEHILIKNCVLHDAVEKGVEILDGRYVTVKDNIIYNIGHHSFVGGHAVMRKWDKDYGDDDMNYFRLDISGNLIFGAGQRVYSWVTSKDFSEQVIDEGKTILIDNTNDTQCKMRIANNLMLYNGITDVRTKITPNFEIFNNTMISDKNRIDPTPSGIDAKNFSDGAKVYNNAAQTAEAIGRSSINVGKMFPELLAVPPATEPNYTEYMTRFYGNYAAGGGAAKPTYVTGGITDLGSGEDLFRNSANNDFRMREDLPQDVGVPASELTRMMDMVGDHGVTIKSNNWRHNHVYHEYLIINNVDTANFTNPTYHAVDSVTGEPSITYDVSQAWRDARIAEGHDVWNTATTFKLKLHDKFNDWVTEQKGLDADFNPLTDLGSDSENWLDNDGDGVGNANDSDDDNDGVLDVDDTFPKDKDEWLDTDSNGTGNNANTDDDGDGIEDSLDPFPIDDNQAPVVDAGNDGSILPGTSIQLNGAVTDSGTPAVNWSVVSAPAAGLVTFSDVAAVNSTASFSSAGIYILRMTAVDDTQTTHDYLMIEAADTIVPPAFGLKLIQEGVELTWTVESENGLVSYIVQKKVDDSWQDVETVLAKGGADNEYSVTILAAATYRLVAVADTGFRQIFDSSFAVSTSLNVGWNMLSIPFDDVELDTIKAKTSAQLWTWENGKYVFLEKATALTGFWLYSDDGGDLRLEGNAVTEMIFNLKTGWNLVGPGSNTIAPSGYNIFNWETAYQSVLENQDTLIQGRGYWFYSSTDQDLNIGE